MRSESKIIAHSEAVSLTSWRLSAFGQFLQRFKRAVQKGLVLLLLLMTIPNMISCRCESEKIQEKLNAPQSLQATPEGPQFNRAGDWLRKRLSSCRILQDGIVFQLGAPESDFRNGFSLRHSTDVARNRFGGVAVRHLEQMRTRLEFWTGKEMTGVRFDAWARGVDENGLPGSTRIAAYIDGKRLGGTRLSRDKLKRLKISQPEFQLKKGRHELLISISRPNTGVVGAEIAWARISSSQEKPHSDPLLFADLQAELKVDNELRSSIILREETRISCPIYGNTAMKLKSGIALWGKGKGQALFTIVDSAGLRTEIASYPLVADILNSKSETREWKDVTLDLSTWAGELVELEISAKNLDEGTRMAFSEPIVFTSKQTRRETRPANASTSPQSATPRAQRVVLIVLSGLSAKHFIESSAQNGFSALNRLATEGTNYSNYRSTTTWSGGVVASLLTETPSWVHQLNGPADTLSRHLPTLAEAIQAQGGRTAFFTSVPTSFSRSGLSRGFEEFAEYSPVSDISAIEPILAAEKWLKSTTLHDGPVFTFIHLRGGHPPFDITREHARELPPLEYGGDLTPRRAALQLSAIRTRSHPSRRRMPEEDWIRFSALQREALQGQSTAINAFIDSLQKQGLYESTTLIIAGDVNAGERPHLPFATKAPLTAEYLRVPLVIKFANQGERLPRKTSLYAPRDLSFTMRRELGVAPLNKHAQELNDLRKLGSLYDIRPFYAFRGDSYSTFWGPYVLRGREGHAPDLYQQFLDPQLKHDRTQELPLVQRALWANTFSIFSQSLPAPKNDDGSSPEADLLGEEPYDESDPVAKAMIVWGIPQ